MNKLCRVSLFLFLFLSFSQVRDAQAQDFTTFILLRHAEVVDSEDSDPVLNEQGKSRAEQLAIYLEYTNLSAIYSTPYRRTRSTVQPLAESKGLAIIEYEPFAGDLLDEMLAKHRGGIILISGHSNTTPELVNKLLGNDTMDQLSESDYDNLFIVTVTEIGKGKLVHLTY